MQDCILVFSLFFCHTHRGYEEFVNACIELVHSGVCSCHGRMLCCSANSTYSSSHSSSSSSQICKLQISTRLSPIHHHQGSPPAPDTTGEGRVQVALDWNSSVLALIFSSPFFSRLVPVIVKACIIENCHICADAGEKISKVQIWNASALMEYLEYRKSLEN